VLNALATVIFVTLIWLTHRRGATDPVCGMTVDREKAVRLGAGSETVYFCSAHCRDAYGRPASSPPEAVLPVP